MGKRKGEIFVGSLVREKCCSCSDKSANGFNMAVHTYHEQIFILTYKYLVPFMRKVPNNHTNRKFPNVDSSRFSHVSHVELAELSLHTYVTDMAL